jgi:hypothetical protein
MRFVDLTVQYDQETVNGQKDVGGPIDAVEMDQDGSVRWFALKPNCKKD